MVWAALIGAIGGVVRSVDRPPSTVPLDQFPSPVQIQPLVFAPTTEDLLGGFESPLAPVTLSHRRHVTRLAGPTLFMTGLLEGDGASTYTDLIVEVRCLDAAGIQLAAPRATLACDRLGPKHTCTWTLDATVPLGVTQLEVQATGVRDLFTPLD